MTDYRSLRVDEDGPITTITLTRAEAHNSVDTAAHHDIQDAFLAARDRDGLRALVFAAEGKTFSAGGDFDEILRDRIDVARRSALADVAKPLLMSIADCPVPVVTALQGDAIGLGATLILASDAIVAARKARLADPHVMIGLAAGDGGCVVWPQHVGLLRAKRYLLTGDRVTAEDAHAMGLVTDLVDEPADALPAALALARRIVALPPLAVQRTKRALNQLFRNRIEELFEYAMALELETFASEDVVEAIAAVRERRPGVFHGR